MASWLAGVIRRETICTPEEGPVGKEEVVMRVTSPAPHSYSKLPVVCLVATLFTARVIPSMPLRMRRHAPRRPTVHVVALGQDGQRQPLLCPPELDCV